MTKMIVLLILSFLWIFVVQRASWHLCEYLFLADSGWLNIAESFALQFLLIFFGVGIILKDRD